MGESAANNELFVDLLHKGDQFIIPAESRLSICAHACNSIGGVKIGRSGTLGRSHYFLFQIGNAPPIVHNKV